MELINKYQNGNVLVSLYEDGTKIQEYSGKPNPTYPVSMDVKITNYCDLNCSFCHEKSTTKGKHSNLTNLLLLLSDLPRGTELAIGGGNPLAHPDLEHFLRGCKKLGLICNITVNYKHIPQYHDILNDFINEKLVYGIGISIDKKSKILQIFNLIPSKNIVFHVIAGVDSISILEKIRNSRIGNCKVLILGYKQFGRGEKYFNKQVQLTKEEWYNKIHNYIGKIHLSFDNLAITQLNIKRFLSEKNWEKFYMGDDGQFTMYIDSVKNEYSVSSTSKQRFMIDTNINKCFNNIKCYQETRGKP